MAKDKDLQTKREGIAFEDDPEQYCKNVYQEARARNDQLAAINRENRLFYEGEDQKLKDRENDPDVQRSGLFIHELKPAIDTRISGVITKLEELEFPVTFRPRAHQPSGEESDRALWIARTINEQMRDCGYLAEGYKDHCLASEIYRSPATAKVGWEQLYEKVPVVKEPDHAATLDMAARGEPPPEPKVWFENKYKGGRPYVELLAPDEFLYEPAIANFQNDSEAPAHAQWVTWAKLNALANEHDWDKKKIARFKQEIGASDEDGHVEDAHEDKIQADKDTPLEHGYRDGKILVVEFYVRVYNGDGEEQIRQVVQIANKYIVFNRATPYKGIRFPFVPVTANRMPGSIEGLSSVDIGKDIQRVFNEIFNSFLDGVSYRTFPPIIQEQGTTFQERPKWGPGQVWKVANAEGLRPFIENPGPLPDMASLMQAVSSKLRTLLNSEDISQGFQSQEYEKATSTRLRASGAAKRSVPTNKLYGQVLIEVAKMFLALNQQYHPEGPKFVMDVVIDVPSLTAISDPEDDKREALLLLSTAQSLEMYQTPTGKIKFRNLVEDTYRAFKKVDVDKYVPTEEELISDMEAMRNLQVAQAEKESAQEQIQIAMSQGGR